MFRFFRRPKVRSRPTRPSRRPRRRQGTTRFLTELSPQRRRQLFFERLRESGRRKRRRIAPRPKEQKAVDIERQKELLKKRTELYNRLIKEGKFKAAGVPVKAVRTDKPRQTPNRSVLTKDRAVEEKRIMEQRAKDIANRQNLINQRLIQEQNKKFKSALSPKNVTAQRKDFDMSKVRFLTPRDLYGALKKRQGKDVVVKPRRKRQRPSIKKTDFFPKHLLPKTSKPVGKPMRSTGYTSAKQVRSASPVTTTVKAPPKKQYTGLRVDPVRAKRRPR